MNQHDDLCTQKGAQVLKERIEKFWSDQGYLVDVRIVEAGFVATMRSARVDVRSNMINGKPRHPAIA